MTKNEYPHFNPAKYDVQVVWIPKYRKKLLTGKVRDVLADIIEGQCQDVGVECLALEIMPDHVHLFIAATPSHTPWEIVKQIKGNTSIQLRRCFKSLKSLGYGGSKIYPSLWARGYYIGSAGHVSQDAVKRYILEQQGKPVFEYSIFGDSSGQTKIGDFTR